MKYLKLLTSKTVLGTIGGVATWLTTLPVIDIKHVVGGASVVLTGVGLRDALDKIVKGIPK